MTRFQVIANLTILGGWASQLLIGHWALIPILIGLVLAIVAEPKQSRLAYTVGLVSYLVTASLVYAFLSTHWYMWLPIGLAAWFLAEWVVKRVRS